MNPLEKLKASTLIIADTILKTSPRWVDLQIVHRCNLKCIMCDSWERKTKHPDLSKIKSIITKLKAANVERINLWGGEPYMRKDISEVFKFIKASGMKCKITTNGTIFTEKSREATLKYVDNITFSIDSADAATHDKIRGKVGAFDKTLKNLKILYRLKKESNLKTPYIEIDCTIQKLNIRDLIGILKLGKKFDASINFDPVQLEGIGNHNNPNLLNIDKQLLVDSIDELIQKKKGYEVENSSHILELCKQYMLGNEIHTRCISPYINTLVDINGDVQFCWGWDKVVGNIFENTMEEVWKNRGNSQLRKDVQEGKLERCKKCCFSHTRWPFKNDLFGKILFGNRD